MQSHPIIMTIAADVSVLLSPWKPIIIAASFIPWAWLISSKLEKDAGYFHLNRIAWNYAYLGCGAAAALAMFLIPIFYVSWPVGLIIMWTPIFAYWKVRNAAVPENKRFYLTSETIAGALARRKAERAQRTALITFYEKGGKEREVPLKETPLFPTHLVAEDLLGPAVDARSSRLEMAPSKTGYVVAQTVDGVKYRRDPLAPEVANPLIDYLKDIAGLDVQNRRRRQVGHFEMRGPNGRTRIAMTVAGSSAGQEMRIEFDRAERLNVPFDNLGLLEQQIRDLRALEAAEDRHGIVLIGAPPGQGLSTLGYSIVGRHDAYTTNVKSLEREIMMRHDGVDHQEFDSDNPNVDFATNLQSILRRDPDVVLVSDIMDKDTARIAAIHTDKDEGPLIYIPQRLPGVKEQIVDWVKRVGDIKTAVKPLRAVVNGRLIRSLCPNCKQGYQPSREQLQRLHLPAEKVPQLFKAGGKVQVKNKIENCPVCQGTGYVGQAGVFEVMMLDDSARKMIANNDLPGAYMHCRRNNMIFLQEAALKKVVEGVTTLEEVARVVTPAKSAPKPAPEPQPATA